ncbi:acyl-CoA dehydrogenase family protein [Pseudomonas sp. CT11-2]|uniref:acyl-CoA dehydrogenase family protein n=1 Tax=Pseudomonas sp. CT11-2 TaxID=3243023 RepID=UPI0039AFA22B
MDFKFTADQILFRDTMRRFFLVEAAPEMLRELWETEAGRSPQLRRKIAEQGLTALSVGEAYGGLGCGDVDWALMMPELGYFAIPDSLAGTAYLAAAMLNALPDESLVKQEWLPRVADGSARIAVGHPINLLVADAHLCDLLLLAHEGEVHALHRDEVKLERNSSVDLSRRLSHVSWTPTDRSRIADTQSGQLIWTDTLERGALATSGQLLGLAKRMLDLAIDYTAERKQFGKPIGSFQAVKHHLANVAVLIEFAKPVFYRAAYAVEHQLPNREIYVSHAKLAAGEAALLAAKMGIQVHGAMGYTWEVDLQIFMKRAWALVGTWGDRGFHKARVAEFVLDNVDQLGPGNTFNLNE